MICTYYDDALGERGKLKRCLSLVIEIELSRGDNELPLGCFWLYHVWTSSHTRFDYSSYLPYIAKSSDKKWIFSIAARLSLPRVCDVVQSILKPLHDSDESSSENRRHVKEKTLSWHKRNLLRVSLNDKRFCHWANLSTILSRCAHTSTPPKWMSN